MVRTATTCPWSLKRPRNSRAAVRSASSRSPRGQVARASSNSWKGLTPTRSGLSIVAMALAYPGMHDLACVVHLHSTYSDGTGTVEEIVQAAKDAQVDVVLLTDHDSLGAKRDGHEGWHGTVLLLVGEEISPRGGDHYLAFGLEEHVRHTGKSPAEICREVREKGGFGFAAHPWSKGSERFRRPGMPFRDIEAADGVEV